MFRLITSTSALAILAALATTPVLADPNWTGLTLGVGVAGGGMQGIVTTDNYGSASYSDQSAVLTLALGGDVDMGRFVLGVEGDITPLGFHASGMTDGGASFDVQLRSLISGRVKAGIKVDRALLYVTGGLASSNATLTTSYSDIFKTANTSRQLGGVVVGAGAEYALTDTVALKADALYFKMDPISNVTTGPSIQNSSTSTDGFVIKGGLNFRIR